MPESPASNLMDLLLDAVCVVTEEGVFLSVTGACERIFGYTPQELLGRQMLELVYEPDRARTLGAVARLMNGHLQYDFENRYVRKDGSIVHIMWSARWYKDKKIRVAVARDITDRKIKQIEVAQTNAASPWHLSGSPPCLVPPNATPIPLSRQDYTVLAALASGGDAVSRKAIVQALGKDYLDYDQRRLDTQMRRLRRKVEQASGLRLPIATLRGIGYRFYEPIELRP
ncbi:PAS domain S-box protein [Pusillimonas sp. TS35]|uniref:PAS domain S-box protein n=1 Tax=Paracandidimonas lactea TaxID=2895524 RepID=UPI00136CD259|nr:PAS domain S-box protein [Paracandidimonas lactea]MYN13518.1 PAS domain S-box protein [Pusillimonas sp. TS35]